METLSQILAVVIFCLMFAAIIWGKIHRYIPALIGASLVIVVVFLIVMRSPEAVITTLNVKQLVMGRFWLPGHEPLESVGVNWQTIIFIAGMMVMVEGLSAAGFFRWICLTVAKWVNYQVIPIFIAFIVLSGFLSMFIDSITVLLFLASVIIELAKLLKFDPVPMIIAAIFAANTGGSVTMSGDPPNIIIGTAFGFTFNDFITHTGPIAWAGMVITVIFFYFVYRKTLAPKKLQENLKAAAKYPEPREAITNFPLFLINAGIFLLMIVLLITHAQTGMSVATIGMIITVLTLLVARKSALHIIKRVDWRTLVFFLGLFICVGGLEQTGALKVMADFISDIAGGNSFIVVSIILWISAFMSAFVDNIPFAATMVPVLSGLAQQGMNLHTLSWALALGTDIGGNATPIGASANVVGTAIAEREGYKISWGRFCKTAWPGMMLVVGLCWLLLFLIYF